MVLLLTAQYADHGYAVLADEHGHHHVAAAGEHWEGSLQGIAYSEFNHHLAGVFLLLIGLSEVRQAFGWPALSGRGFCSPGPWRLAVSSFSFGVIMTPGRSGR